MWPAVEATKATHPFRGVAGVARGVAVRNKTEGRRENRPSGAKKKERIMTDRNIIAAERQEQEAVNRELLRALVGIRYKLITCHQETGRLLLEKNGLRRMAALAQDEFTQRFTQQCMSRIDREMEKFRKFKRMIAELLPELFWAIDSSTLTLEQKCDALNVNAADRVGLEPDARMMDLIFLHALEDSAARRGQDFNDAPLFNVAMLAFANFLKTPQGAELCNEQFAATFGDRLPDKAQPALP